LHFSTILNFGYSQTANTYFEKIRNEAELTAFFSQMPKGDLHTIAVSEPILEDANTKIFYLNIATMQVLKETVKWNWELFQH
jgi:adenosine deaminase/adenosine deaminase CECR1